MRGQTFYQQLAGTTVPTEFPPPVGGLNTRDSRSSMPPQDAVQFQNMISEPDGVKSRKGNTSFGTGITGNVNTIADFYAGSVRKMVVGAGTVIYSLPEGGGTATSVRTGRANTNYQTAQIGGNMALVNGADDPQIYNGTTSVDAVYTGDLNTDGPENMDGIAVHKNRMYLWDTSTSDFYYGTTDAIQGAFAKFPLNTVSKTGGNLLMMHTISRDGGSGPDDYAAFILDTGEVLVYEGSDPSTASSWSIIGRFFIPPPVNKRSGVEFAGDVIILTTQDIVFLSQVMKSASDTGGVLLDRSKLAGGIRESYNTFGSNDDWQLTIYNNKGWLMVNVPEVDGSSYYQYAYVLSTGAPSYFTGWNGITFGSFNNGLYFGVNGAVYEADAGEDDNGSDIDCLAQQAFSNLGSGLLKMANDLEITYLFDGTLGLGADIIYDYEERPATNTTSSVATGAQWDVSLWDVSFWAGVTKARKSNFTCSGSGIAMSIIMQFSVSGSQVRWLTSRISYNQLSMI